MQTKTKTIELSDLIRQVNCSYLQLFSSLKKKILGVTYNISITLKHHITNIRNKGTPIYYFSKFTLHSPCDCKCFFYSTDTTEPPQRVCEGYPCGPNAICREVGGKRRCSCHSGFINKPPFCRPECVVPSDCPPLLACLKNRCVDPCRGTCGVQAQCQVINHNPICSCLPDFTGDPFIRCTPAPIPVTPRPPVIAPVTGPPTPATPPSLPPIAETTPFSIDQPIRPQTGEPSITPKPIGKVPQPPAPPYNPCFPNPCGGNALCHQQGNQHVCECLSGYYGNPDLGCGPECVLNFDCSRKHACVKQNCVDLCPGACASNAECRMIYHNARCFCPEGYTGDPRQKCAVIPIPEYPSCECHVN